MCNLVIIKIMPSPMAIAYTKSNTLTVIHLLLLS